MPYAPSGLYAGSHSFSVSFGCAFPRGGKPYKWDGFPARPLSLFALRRVAHLVFWDPKNCPIGDLPRLSSRQCFVDRGPKIDEDVRKGVLLRALSCFLSLRYKCTAFFWRLPFCFGARWHSEEKRPRVLLCLFAGWLRAVAFLRFWRQCSPSGGGVFAGLSRHRLCPEGWQETPGTYSLFRKIAYLACFVAGIVRNVCNIGQMLAESPRNV